MYKKNFVKKTLNGFQATPIYFFIDIETISILGQDFGERLKDAFEERDALMVWLYMKKNVFAYSAHILQWGIHSYRKASQRIRRSL